MSNQAPVIFSLQAALQAQAPVVALSIGTFGNSASVTVTYGGAATPQQIANAQAVIASWDWSDAAQAVRVTAANPDLATLRDQAQNALDGNTTYLAIASPTNAQVVAQVQALTQQTQKIIKALKLLAIAALN